jgi:hypothetical protein
LLAKDIPLFNEVNALTIPMDIRRLDDGTGIDATLMGNNVKYHNSSALNFVSNYSSWRVENTIS